MGVEPDRAGDGGRVVVVGTAGHVDHGKSALVRALTGTDPDRLAEEKQRGLTIELGFAWRPLPSGRVLSLIDVPGHEDFIRNMLAGAGGIDACILVVAADEGPMPQTREHLAILDLMGVGCGVVAITKADLVDAEWLDLIGEELRELLAGTRLAGAPILPVSAQAGTGLEALVAALDSALEGLPEAADLGRPRLAVDRAFTLAGFGTVVTGTLRDGELEPGEGLILLPQGLQARVRGLQSHGRSTSRARPGTRTAVNLAGVDADAIPRGSVLTRPGDYRPTRLVDIELRVLPTAQQAIAHDLAVHVFHGASEIPAHVRVIGQREIAPGRTGPAQLRLERPTVMAAGDRLVLRLPSPSQTLGGGRVLDPRPPGRRRRFAEPVLARFAALSAGAPEDRAWLMLAEREPCPAAALQPPDTGLSAEARGAALNALAEAGRALDLGGMWITDRGWARLRRRAEIVLARHHARFPLRAGPPLEELRERLRLAPEAFGPVLARAQAEGWLLRDAETLRLPSHDVALSAEQTAAADRLLARFRADPFKTPSAKEAEEAVGAAVLEALLARGDLVQASPEVLFDRQGFAALEAAVVEHCRAQGQVTVADLRDRFGTSRKYALAILEHFDRLRLTRRVGDVRVLARAGGSVGASEPAAKG
ncbi:MAG: selenocysteine-specific translation elongation factor [Chloroflexi bacterium]|nr:selenocysteine-specific translation elongation factor [Chloroflexota bacterium]